VADPTLPTIPHFVRGAAFRNAFVAKITWVGILWFGEFSHQALLVFGSLFYSFIEFIPGGMFYIPLFDAGRKESLFMFLRFRLEH